jgi:DNA-binding Lrp family transcriptional regulator
MAMDTVLKLLQKNARLTADELAQLSGQTVESVRERLNGWDADGTILGYQAIIDPEKDGEENVRALIEVRITPVRGGGFDHLADRISKFDQVRDCWLMSGGYDLAVLVEAKNLREVARFVAERLSTLEGILSTATRFQLKVYKQNGLLAKKEPGGERLSVAP